MDLFGKGAAFAGIRNPEVAGFVVHLSAQGVHRKIQKNGSVPSPNPFYTGRKTPEDYFRLLNAMV